MSQASIDIITLPSSVNIDVYHWHCHDNAQGVIHILHGMAEHCLRYQRLAEFLNRHGWHVIAHNHRGHGPNRPLLGHCQLLGDEKDDWSTMVDDAIAVSRHGQQHWPTLPLILLGHSMGSFMAQHCVMRQAALYDALILSGSSLPKPRQIKVLQPIIGLEKWRLGATRSSPLLTWLSYGDFNRQVDGQRTPFDWLSRDQDQVDAYLNDPLCNFACSTGFWQSFSHGLLAINATAIDSVDRQLPIYILSGTHDPVGGMARGVSELATLWRQHGNPVDIQLYPEARHELFNENNYLEVYHDLQQWLINRRKKTA